MADSTSRRSAGKARLLVALAALLLFAAPGSARQAEGEEALTPQQKAAREIAIADFDQAKHDSPQCLVTGGGKLGVVGIDPLL